MVWGSRRWSNQSPTGIDVEIDGYGLQNQWLFVCHVTKWCKTIWQTRNTIFIFHQDRLWDPELHIGRLSVRIFWFMVRKYISHIIYIEFMFYEPLWNIPGYSSSGLIPHFRPPCHIVFQGRRDPHRRGSPRLPLGASSAGRSGVHKKPVPQSADFSGLGSWCQCWYRKWEDVMIVMIIMISIIIYIYNTYIIHI